MSFWLIVLGLVFALATACGVYLVSRVRKFGVIRRLREKSKPLAIVVSILSVAVPFGVITLIVQALNAMIVIIHFAIIWVLSELIYGVILRIRGKKLIKEKDLSEKEKKELLRKPYFSGMMAAVVTLTYLSIALYLALSIKPTEYRLTTDKEVGSLRVIMFADAHLGTTFGADNFRKAVEEMNSYNPDVVVISGDFVDDGTPTDVFNECCEVLGELKTKYGVYYVFGNHDKSFTGGHYPAEAEMLTGIPATGQENTGEQDQISSDTGKAKQKRSDAGKRNGKNIIYELNKNGVTVLQDDAVLIDDRFYIIGRQDYSMGTWMSSLNDDDDEPEDPGNAKRKSMRKLIAPLNKDKYMIVLDHQPRDFEAQEAAGVDLVLSGHTHGGQMLPIGFLVGIMGDNDLVNGYERRSNTDFIVTSGISDWELVFKTGCRSEYTVIDIQQK